MQSKEFCVYNETRENVLSSRVTVIDTKMDPLKMVKALIEGPGAGLGPGEGANHGAGLWLNPLKTVPAVSTLSPYDLVYLDQDCRVVHSVAVIPDNEVPQFTGKASSALLLPLHTFTASQTHPGDQFVICAFEEIQRRPAHVSVSSTLAPAPLAALAPALRISSAAASVSTTTGILPLPPGASSQQQQTATWHFEPSDRSDQIQSENSESNASKIGFLRGIVHLRVHISISMAPVSDAVPHAKPAKAAPAAQWSGNLSLPAPAHWLEKCSAQWAKQRAALKTRLLHPINDLFQRRIHPTVAAFSQWVAKAARTEATRATAKARSLKLRYLRWADQFIFRSTPISTPSTTAMDSAKHRPPFDDRRRRLLKARFLR
jgi:hypothetical protein